MSSAYAQQYKIQSPLQISGCQLWMDGQDTNNMNLSGTTINWINDKSGNGYFISSMSGNQKPKITTSFNTNYTAIAAINEGTGNKIIGTPRTIAATSVQGATGLSYFLVGQFISGYGLVQFEQTGTGGTRIIDIETNGNNARIDYNSSSLLPSDAINIPFLGSVVFNSNAGNLAWFYNGNASSNASRTSATLSYSSGYGFFGQNSGTSGDYPTFGYIGEYVGYNVALTTAQRQQVEGYLAWKWGLQSKLPTSHPYYATNAALFGFSNMPPILFPTTQTNKLIFNSNYPASLSGLSMWFDAADRTTITLSGTNVAQWNDKSGKGNNLSAASARPTYTSNAQNNLNVVTYDGTQNLTTGSISANNFAGGTTNLTTFVVFSLSNTNTGTNYSSPFCWANGGGAPRIAATWEGTSAGLEMDVGSVNPIRTSFTSPALATNNTFYFLSYWKNGATTQLNVNGSNGASGSGQDTTNYGSCNFDFNVGNGFSNSQYFMRGNIGELIFFSTTLNTTNFQKIEGYLAYKWGLQSTLPTTHPYYSSNSFNLSTFTTRNYDKYAQQNKSYFIDSPLWFSFGIPTSNFSASLPLSLNGNTTYNGSILQLTPNSAGQTGSAYYNKQVRIQKWSTQFNLRFDSTQADGTTLCIQPSSITSLGATGGGLGYSGIANSVAIRFDTYNGSGGQFSTDVLTGGTISTDQGASGVLNTSLNLTAGTTWNFLIKASYDGTTLSYSIQNFSNPAQIFTSNHTINIPTTIGSCNAFVGFTSATGGLTETCSILSWNWSNAK